VSEHEVSGQIGSIMVIIIIIIIIIIRTHKRSLMYTRKPCCKRAEKARCRCKIR